MLQFKYSKMSFGEFVIYKKEKGHEPEDVPDIILNRVLHYYKLSLEEVSSRSRKYIYLESRRALFYFLYNYSVLSINEIGKLVGYNHATVLNALKTISNLLWYKNKSKTSIIDLNEIIKNALYQRGFYLKELSKKVKTLRSTNKNFFLYYTAAQLSPTPPKIIHPKSELHEQLEKMGFKVTRKIHNLKHRQRSGQTVPDLNP